jgi:hypothetical protein
LAFANSSSSTPARSRTHDGGIDRRRQDLVGAIDVARERRRERDVAGRGEPVGEAEHGDLPLGDQQRRGRRDEHRPREAQVAARGSPVRPQAQRVRGHAPGCEHGGRVAAERPDDERPDADTGEQQRDGDGDGPQRHDRLQRAQPHVVHALEEHPLGCLQRERERQVGDGEREREQLVVVIERGQHRRQQRDGERAEQARPARR